MSPSKKQSIEDYILTLDDITSKLENEDVSLDEAVKLYKTGMETAKKAEKMLLDYEKEITIINESESSLNG